MRKFKAVLFIIAIAMLLPLIAACNKQSGGNETDPVADTTAEQAEPPYDFMAKFTENGNPLYVIVCSVKAKKSPQACGPDIEG